MRLSKKTLLLLAAAGATVCLGAMGVVFIGLFVMPSLFVDHFLPAYTSEQTPSAHPGYRHTAISSRGLTYVQDYNEYSLRLINPEPTKIIGRHGVGKVCAIPGQRPADYVAVDVGSEMPAYEVFRRSELPPFDWRHAAFQTMEFNVPSGRAPHHKQTADQALIAEVVRTLNEGTPADPPPPPGSMTEVFELSLFSDQLPGLTFSPKVYLDAAGPVYLAENAVLAFTSAKTTRFNGRWIPAPPQLAKWLQHP
jgi:hypothetical protein